MNEAEKEFLIRLQEVAIGDRVKALGWRTTNEDGTPCIIDDNITVPVGTCGTVRMIDDAGTIFVKWDNGSGIGLIPDVDQFEILEEDRG